MLEHLQHIIRRKKTGLWVLALMLLLLQILPLHFHQHAVGHEPVMAHHHTLMSYLNDGGDDIADQAVQTIDLVLHSLSSGDDVQIPVLLFSLVLLLAVVACYRCLAIRPAESPRFYPPGSHWLPPLRAPPIH